MVRTMAGDHTINVTFNLPEYCMPQAQQLMGWVNDMVTVVVQLSGTESGGK